MMDFFSRPNRIKIEGENIYIDNQFKNNTKEIEVNHIFEFKQPIPEIKVYENQKLIRRYKIETLKNNPNLENQFLHSSIRVLPNSAVMIDGIISNDKKNFKGWTEDNYEGVRLQPFYLSDKDENNIQLIGKGLFDRGLHFNGTITPKGVRCVCICDNCFVSFTIQHFHAGFSECQYFYSTDSEETLIVPYHMIPFMPKQLQKEIEGIELADVETKLPLPSNQVGEFKYYNSFKCPHCRASFVDFENNPSIRPQEYYGNTYINQNPVYFNK